MTDHAKDTMTSAQFEAAYEAFRAAMPQEARKADMLAQVRRVHYEASIRKGFAPEEALCLCTQTQFD